MLKSLVLVCISLSGFCQTALATERFDERSSKSLIVGQLLSLIQWKDTSSQRPMSGNYQLCTYRDSQAFKSFQFNLKKLVIGKQQLKLANMTELNELTFCHAVFLTNPEKENIDWILNNNLIEKTLFIVQGAQYADKGFHISLYLNKQNTFNFKLNPDAFVASHLTPSQELLKHGKVINSDVSNKTNLLRSLINYTEWSESERTFENSKNFKLCIFKSRPLATFITHFSKVKAFKGKQLQVETIDSTAKAANCHAVVIGKTKNKEFIELLAHREKSSVLLIGNDMSLGERGTHYNLEPKKSMQQFRFEINLMAFKKTKHTPRFELFNSGLVVEKDYPELSKTLQNLVNNTSWPNIKPKNKLIDSVRLCVYQEPEILKNLKLFLDSQQVNESNTTNRIVVKKIEEINQLIQCDALLTSSFLQKELASLLAKKELKKLLLITHQTETKKLPFHYNIIISPKKIAFELNVEKLKKNGFIPDQKLLSSGKVFNRGLL